MKIIIVGCGKVGSALAEQLDHEGHEITVVDQKSSALHNITDTLDVLGVVGNGACYSIQLAAGIETTDLLIAVTNSDELNLLCCMIAQKAASYHTIARLRNPEYHIDKDFIKEGLGLSMIINPEAETATDITRLIRLPSAIKIDTFAKGKVEMLKFHISENSVLNNMVIKNIPSQLHCDILVCVVERGEEVFIPSGNSIIQANDKISIVATPKEAMEFFRKIGVTLAPIKNVMLVGGGNIAVYLAQKFIELGVTVKIVEQSWERCEQLSEMLPKALIINANASEYNVLVEEGIETIDAFASLTNMDEENILLSLYAQKKTNAKVFTKITRLNYEDITREMELGTIVNPKLITADRIVQHVRAMQNPKGSNVETLYKIIGDKVEALEFRIRNNSKIVGIPLEKLNLKDNLLVSCIIRKSKIIIPNGQISLQLGDSVIIVTTHTGLNDLNDILL
jgi:trk system potassium uptake protein TrkA